MSILHVYCAPYIQNDHMRKTHTVLKSTEWKKKTEKKTGHQASAQTEVWGYVCPANRELTITYYIGLSLLASIMF